MTIKDKYQVVTGESEDLPRALRYLEQKVNILYHSGWKPQGGVAIRFTSLKNYYVCQAMVKN